MKWWASWAFGGRWRRAAWSRWRAWRRSPRQCSSTRPRWKVWKSSPSRVQEQQMFFWCFQVEKLVAAKVERGKNYRTLVNFSRKEMDEVNSKPLPLNSTLWRWRPESADYYFLVQTNAFQGRRAGKLPSYKGLLQVVMSIKFKCECLLDSCSRKEGVTVGGLSLAASYMAQVKQLQSMDEVLRLSFNAKTPNRYEMKF